MKSIFSIVLIVILFFAVSGPPIDIDGWLRFEPKPIEDKVIDEVIAIPDLPKYKFESGLDSRMLINPETITVSVSTTVDSHTLNFYDDKHLNAKLFKNGFELDRFNVEIRNEYSDLLYVNISKDNPLRYSIDLSKASLNIPDGRYTLVISPNNDSIIGDVDTSYLEFDIEYSSSSIIYRPVAKSSPAGVRYIRVHYIDELYRTLLIPVSRLYPERQAGVTSVYEGLRNVPANLGFLSVSPIAPIPIVNYIYIPNRNSEVAYVDISLSRLEQNPDKRFNEIAIEAYASSVVALSANLNRIEFTTRSGEVTVSTINGIDTSNQVRWPRVATAYLAYENPSLGIVYLFDYRMPELIGFGFEEALEAIIERLYRGMVMEDYLLSPVIVSPISTDRFVIEDGSNLSIIVNQEMWDILNANPNKLELVADSLVLSLLSIPGINTVSFIAPEIDIEAIGGYILNTRYNQDSLSINPIE